MPSGRGFECKRLISPIIARWTAHVLDLGELMASLLLPEKVTLRLVDSERKQLRVSNILFFVHAFANYKNDFDLGPFVSDADGIVTITRDGLLAEANAHYDSGLMDYRSLEDCKEVVEIRAIESQEVEKALDARTRIWTGLLRGESERWANIEELRNVYRTAANKRISVQPLRVQWDGSQREVEYLIPATLR